MEHRCKKCQKIMVTGKQYCGFCGTENSQATKEPLKIWEMIVGGVGGIIAVGIMGLGILATIMAIWFTGVDIFDGKDSALIPIQNRKYETFSGYECTSDCSGHQAGYDWAEEKDISDIDDCGGKSDSFIEGCRVYVGENY
jgi:hypothetical protein